MSREDLVAQSLLTFFDSNTLNQQMYLKFHNESIRPRILEFWFLRYCRTRNICVPRSCDGVSTPVTALYKQHLASFHKQFFSITRIPRRDRTSETALNITFSGKEYRHTLAEWNVIRFLLEDNATILLRFLQDRTDVENACRMHRKGGITAFSAAISKFKKRKPAANESTQSQVQVKLAAEQDHNLHCGNG